MSAVVTSVPVFSFLLTFLRIYYLDFRTLSDCFIVMRHMPSKGNETFPADDSFSPS